MTDVAAAVPANETPGVNLSNRQKLEILLAILLALFLFALDQTVVGTALPIIVTDLNGNSLYTWAVTIYLLTSTISGPIYGKLSDLYGRRPIFIWALVAVPRRVAPSPASARRCGSSSSPAACRASAVARSSRSRSRSSPTCTRPQERGKYGALFGAVFGLSSRARSAARRVRHRHVGLALDLLRQRAARPRLALRVLAAAAADQATRGRPEHRLPRRRPSSRRRSSPFLIGLSEQADRRMDGSLRSAG